MWIFVAAAVAVAVYWAVSVVRERQKWAGREKKPPEAPQNGLEPLRRRLEDSPTVDLLGEVVDGLMAVMEHPELGGPGFLTVQFPQQLYAGSFPTVSCQFPNISEGLYRRVVRRELDRQELVEAGVPESLFAHHLTFAAESGGVVLLTAEVYGVDPEIERQMARFRSRGEALRVLSEALGRRCPACSVNVLGGDILLSPERRENGVG